MISVSDLWVDVDSRRASRFGVMIRLSPHMATILDILNHRYPKAVSRDSIIMRVYGDEEEPDLATEGIRVRIAEMRKLLKPLGVEIKNAWAFGYFLELHNEGIA